MLKCPNCNNKLYDINIVSYNVTVIDNYSIEDNVIDICDSQRMDEVWDCSDEQIVQCPHCGTELPEELYIDIKNIESVVGSIY